MSSRDFALIGHVMWIACLYGLLSFGRPSFAQSREAQTPEGKLAEVAGIYLGVIEYVRVLKQSQCAYAFRRTFPSFDEVLRKEIMPAFSPAARGEVEATISKLKPTLGRQAQKFVGDMITAAQKDLDPKTGCGVAAGMLAAIGSQAGERWSSAKLQFGWKER